ncbi:EthD domain-containing protein [Sphingomonas sp. IC-11]|uniref:EthD domain-containing protein n=1 Tax=Sphingomonas sp. IC-11 TaxID=2898528 RepID=UPI001E601FA1|nr:EthD domain-containing protein [Sphingomonas sp. IC-11]MCD2315274.1 EthD domain-containing protein [Sphingomonas sp. IC-11]
MIKMIFCLRRRPELSLEEFQTYWRERHAPLVAEVAPLLRIRRYVQSHSFEHPQLAGPVAARGATVPPYDGIAELHWDSIDDLVAVNDSKEARDAGRRLLEDERNFIDLSQSPLFWVRENHVI